MVWNEQSSTRYYGVDRAHFEAKGNLDIPCRYVNADRIALGEWIDWQRRVFVGKKKVCRLSNEQVVHANPIGMVWDNPLERTWNHFFGAATTFYRDNGHLQVPATYVTPEEVTLSRWLRQQRKKLESGKLSTEEKRRLKEIGFTTNHLGRYENGRNER